MVNPFTQSKSWLLTFLVRLVMYPALFLFFLSVLGYFLV